MLCRSKIVPFFQLSCRVYSCAFYVSRSTIFSTVTVRSMGSEKASWIKEDDPTSWPASPKFKDGYEDILENRRKHGDFRWCLRARNVPVYKYCHPRSPTEIIDYVRDSDRVQYAIEQVMTENNLARKDVAKEAEEILQEMSHNLRIGAIRSIAFVLPKIMKRLYNRIYVNSEGIQRLEHLVHEYPVILMPSHRSYADFLLMSYVFYHYDLPLPVIAAAMDFMGMKGVGWLLRNSGAFYIRRTFGTDKLYWAVFTEYVQTHICNGDAPVEFYVEGTRSRTAKSLTPKLGMLKASLEPYFKAHVPDIMVIPVSISYDRTLEEHLYTYELLGVPKPKESTSGLLKATSILSEDFGNIHINIGDGISVRQFSGDKIDRVDHSLEPRYIASLTDSEEKLISNLAYHVVLEQQKHMVISPWAIIATVLMQNRDGIPLKQLVKEVEWLKRQATNLGGYVDWPGHDPPEVLIRARLELHKNILSMSADDFIELKQVNAPGNVSEEIRRDGVIATGAMQIITSLYRNQLLHLFIRPAMIALSINGCAQETMTLDELFSKYQFLQKLFNSEFIFYPGCERQDFDKALPNLTHAGGVTLENNNVLIKKSLTKHTTFLSQMFEPFLLAYWVMTQYLLSLVSDIAGKPLPKKPKVMCKEAQQLAMRLLQENIIKHYEIMNLDILNNSLLTMVAMGVVTKGKRSGETYISPNQILVAKLGDEIAKYVEIPSGCEKVLLSELNGHSTKLGAKL